jgi:hypothetical protein
LVPPSFSGSSGPSLLSAAHEVLDQGGFDEDELESPEQVRSVRQDNSLGETDLGTAEGLAYAVCLAYRVEPMSVTFRPPGWLKADEYRRRDRPIVRLPFLLARYDRGQPHCSR